VDGDGDVYVSSSGNRRLQKFDSNGNFITKFDIGDQAAGVAVDATGTVYVATVSDVAKFDSNGHRIGTSVACPHYDAYGVALDDHGDVYVSCVNDNVIREYNSSGVGLRTEGNGSTYLLNQPMGIAVAGYWPRNVIYVADTYNNRIQVFGINFQITGGIWYGPRAVTESERNRSGWQWQRICHGHERRRAWCSGQQQDSEI
jgi:NHL repeat